MTEIQISYDVPADKLEEIRKLLSDVAMRDPAWNGAKFDIVRDEFTCLPNDDTADGASLLKLINDIIDK